ncbi:Uncharacterized protein MCHI_001141 [Candidatus Magnetoovum chiemensis]|nr:Uncharacterized protein MCHI_001141 [Candidatus Magnetoovum chiemensis]
MKRTERIIEKLLFSSRWLLAPFYLGLVISILILLIKFIQELAHFIPHILEAEHRGIVLTILTLVDMSLVGNLLIIIIFSGYENFVSKIDTESHQDRPEWMGKVDFAGLKLKLIGSIVAISAIDLLKAFVNITELTSDHIVWRLAIHITFIVSGVLFALMDRLSDDVHHKKAGLTKQGL